MLPTKKSILIKNLKEFSKNEILNYSSNRNFDYGSPHHNVSRLSPYLRRRFISEYEILKIILDKNKISNIEKFIEEIFWRTYWKGWLESHPWIYNEYQMKVDEQIIPPKTGIKCFDHWKNELIETGYLHNHSRMWFASIWIFTLGYSWESGANFFRNHLIDWCPASNTLGWRWVAGIQTIGKPYIAKADNIKHFTANRFYPKNQLNENITLPSDTCKYHQALDIIFPKKTKISNKENIGIILNNNDLTLNQDFIDLGLEHHTCLFNQNNNNKLINKFEKNICEDIVNNNPEIEVFETYEHLFKWVLLKKIKNLILPYQTIGNKIFNSHNFLNKLSDRDINFQFHVREWDRNALPYAKKGFFNFKKNIPGLLKLNHLYS
jgi:deoxyribodipyrimidine photo-lyase